ncbi:probable LRR receptor-like serine/threonine-protein kinase RFK1 [Rosa chinensis]|uniref:probable LRR receptor-like serine/threonine-protein kinase RFK1 n=1 Tax=Rosa chinensis TaxID=74649 RepID=UPI001AD93B3A|nr:probable LRR receptor-like serine/threonine-protein kinase RFK1 [Rosa chinensis]
MDGPNQEFPLLINMTGIVRFLLTGNLLSGNLPDSLLQDGKNVDVSYNNFTSQGPEKGDCQEQKSEYNLTFSVGYNFKI